MALKSVQVAALCVSGVGALFLSSSLYAAGFYLQESSISALGSAFAGSTTNIDDATTVFFNPANMTNLSGPMISGGAHAILVDAELKDAGTNVPAGGLGTTDSPYSVEAVPNLFFAMPVTPDVWFGAGFSAPFGLANEYDEGWFGRYDSTKTELVTHNFSFVGAYKVSDTFSLGGGIDIQYADATLKSAAFGGTEGESTLEGDDWSVGYNLGLLYQVLPTTRVGVHYRSGMEHQLDGRISVEGSTAADFDVAATADLNLPDILSVGVSHDVSEDWTVMGQINWFGWNRFETIRAVDDNGVERSNIVQDYDNTLAFALGAEYAYSDRLDLRLGYQFDPTPTTDQYRTSRTPDGNRNWLTAGMSYDVSDKLTLDVAGAYIKVDKEEINVSRNSDLSTVKATSEADIGILSVGVTYRF